MAIYKPFVTSFYSYKGGTGRTTASSNITAFLAKKNLKVVCIDMDLEGPGLSVLFNIKEQERKGLQYIFEEPSFKLDDYIVNLSEITKTDFNDDILKNIYVIPASTQFKKNLDFSDGSKSIRKLKELIEAINENIKPDIIIFDTPSGYGHLSALSIYLSDLLVVFFRWSRQHLLGTVKIKEFAKENDLSQLLVASCVPDVTGNEERKKKYEAFIKPDFEIMDDKELKWVERVILFEPDPESFSSYEGYRSTTKKIISILKENK